MKQAAETQVQQQQSQVSAKETEITHLSSQLEMSRHDGPEVEKWLLVSSEHGMGEASRALALRYVKQGEMSQLMHLIGRCWRRLWQSSSKVGAAALPNIPLSSGA